MEASTDTKSPPAPEPEALPPALDPASQLTGREVSSRAELEKLRAGVVARGPSGACYRIRQINFERHALAGGLPPTLIHYALEGEEGMTRMFQDMATAQEEQGDEQAKAHFEPMRTYLDQVVIASVIEPELSLEDLGTPGKIEEDALLPASDYQWLVSVAMRATDYDAEGGRLWGVEPLSRFLLFRSFHGCDEDCEGCLGVQAAVALGRE